jgi:hypothetical protein
MHAHPTAALRRRYLLVEAATAALFLVGLAAVVVLVPVLR